MTDEVLKQQPQRIKEFLLKTSILDQLYSPLCDAVTLQTNGQAVLEHLESGNLFIAPLDNNRRWYRYHHLFSDLLEHNLSLTFPDQIPVLNLRASVWYENNGYLDRAIYHAQSAGAQDRVAFIIEDHWQEYIHRGELTSLQAWLDSLNPQYTKNSAPLSMAYCWINVMTRTFKPLPGYVKDIRAAFGPIVKNEVLKPVNKMAVIPSLLETIETIISLDNNHPQKAETHAKKAISLIPADLPLISQESPSRYSGLLVSPGVSRIG